MKPFKTVDQADLAYFEALLPGRVLHDSIPTDYDHDEMTEYGHSMPEAVLQCLSAEDVQGVMAYCSQNNIAVTPRGAGTGLCGGCVPIEGGVILSTEKMKKVLEIDPRNMTASHELLK